MDNRLLQDLLMARKSIKRKYDSLKQDSAAIQRVVEQQFQPITQPLKEFISSAKFNNVNGDRIAKVEPSSHRADSPIRKHVPPQTSTPRKVARNLFSINEPSILEDVDEYGDSTPDEANLPTLDELREELEDIGSSPAFEEYLNQYQGLPKIYVEGIFRDINNEYDHRYGVRYDPTLNKFYVGNSELDFKEEDIVIIPPTGDKFTYKGTPGLYELLFKRNPIGYQTRDSKAYRDIIGRTNAARRNYDATSQIQGSGQSKYVNIIKPLLQTDATIGSRPASFFVPSQTSYRPRASSASSKRGEGVSLPTLRLNNKKIEFVPWNNPNKLVDWLRVLLGSKSAGNTANNNEIVYIIEELRHSRIIK
ncbi:hypothetical protein RI129_005525 [Pyrocoelia pectoralis]|uniref:DUF8207 domain-containing protein n=1 Tax=Pyrocoelia pectoralis TaxID=417401 RepID=A0AAN7ZSG3_9COLE